MRDGGGATDAVLAEAAQTVGSVLPHFEALRGSVLQAHGADGDDAAAAERYAEGVAELVAAHLVELWAVGLLGADRVGAALQACCGEGEGGG